MIGFIKAGKLILLMIVFLPTLFFWPWDSRAIMLKMSLDQLEAGADAIVAGKVLSIQGEWNTDRTSIYTLVVVSVEEWVKGDNGLQEVVIILQGGEVGGEVELKSDKKRGRG